MQLFNRFGLPVHFDGSAWRVLGYVPRLQPRPLPNFRDAYPVIPSSSWEETAVDLSQVPVFDQGPHGSCTGHGSVTAFTFAWLISGQPFYAFSPTSVYARINGGTDRGASVSDALTALKQYGTCFMAQFGEDQLFMSQMSQDAITTAARFRVDEAYTISSWEEMGSALTHGLMVVSGLAVGQNFSMLDANGVCPLPNQVAGGHCLAHYGLKKINGTWVVATRNSWGAQWGRGGDCYLQQGAWNPMYGFPFDAYAIGGVLTDPQSTNDPPVITN